MQALARRALPPLCADSRFSRGAGYMRFGKQPVLRDPAAKDLREVSSEGWRLLPSPPVSPGRSTIYL